MCGHLQRSAVEEITKMTAHFRGDTLVSKEDIFSEEIPNNVEFHECLSLLCTEISVVQNLSCRERSF
jgi:hypothetical protein